MLKLSKLILPLSLGLLLLLGVVQIISGTTPGAIPKTLNTGQHFLPPYGNDRDRFGFDSGALTGYDVAQLHAGWYSNWGAGISPAHPDQIVYVQLIRFHAGADSHDPTQVTVKPDRATIARIAAAHPGSLWLMSNEPDSIYQGDPILPEVYAVVYHDFYTYIKGLDPSAIIANGGIVQPTPCRLAYLDIVWDTYQQTFGEPWPVDVWNVHAFILREVYGGWGASTPPGVDPSCGIDYSVEDGGDIGIFWDNIRAMRSWMKEKGEQDKPLIISEYGILWPEWFAPQFTPQRVSQFMTQTFELFLYETDPQIGHPADGNRLVQAWAWYSLSDDQNYNGYLFNSDDKTLSPMGEAYAGYTAALDDVRYADLNVRLRASGPGFTPTLAQTGGGGPLSLTVALTGDVGNLGKSPALDALARWDAVLAEGGTAVWGREAHYTVPARFGGPIVQSALTGTVVGPGLYDIRFSLDPEAQLEEPREWNNVATETLDLRSDLAVQSLAYGVTAPIVQSGTLLLTATVHNRGSWPSAAVSATVSLEPFWGGTAQLPQRGAIPALEIDEPAGVGISLTWSAPRHDLYQLTLTLDEAGELVERTEENNAYSLTVPVVLSTTLYPTATGRLTTVSGAVGLTFPAGTVTTPTRVLYTPVWPPDWASHIAFSLTVEPSALARPVSVTWRYDDAEVQGLEEESLQLFRQTSDGRWHAAACRPYQRDVDQNQLKTGFCGPGTFLFGSRYDLYLPVIGSKDTFQGLKKEDEWLPLEREGPRLPLRLPD